MVKKLEEEIISEILERGNQAIFASNFSRILNELITVERIPDPNERARMRSRIALAMIQIRKEIRERAPCVTLGTKRGWFTLLL